MSRFTGASLADVVIEGIEDRLREFHTAEPGRIVSFDAAKQTAIVRPMLQRAVLDDDDEYQLETPPDIHDVPVQFPRSRLGYLTFPISQGDSGLIVYAMRDIGQWRYTGPQGSPGDQRVASMAGAVFLPGLYPNADKLPTVNTTHVVLAPLQAAHLLLGGPNATQFIAMANLVLSELNAIRNLFNTHTHGGVTTGGGASGVPSALMGPAGSVAATKVKAL